MIGAPLRRLLAWFVVLATLLSACTPAIRLDPGHHRSTDPDLVRPGTPHAWTSPFLLDRPHPPLRHRFQRLPRRPQAFALNLYQEGDFVPQYTFDWCVAASIQIMHNLIDETGGRPWADRVQQGELWEMARARSSNWFNGANPLGWAQVLNEAGMGPYAVVSVADYEAALQTAARAIADTDRPVGLVLWRGRHVSVMSGFESLGDPRPVPGILGHRNPRPRSALPVRQRAVGTVPRAQHPAHPRPVGDAVRRTRAATLEHRSAGRLPAGAAARRGLIRPSLVARPCVSRPCPPGHNEWALESHG